ncbi:MAG TPA: hypothetical protein DDX92_12850 [Flavobacteriales bacterium]|jgi:membrane protease YdiL (CAAX protease family)|nr:hypothetical protein [Flavobacteriales bacterium]
MQKNRIKLIAWVTLLGFPLLGITIVGFVETNPWEFDFRWGSNVILQIGIGSAYGILTGLVAWKLLTTPYMRQVLDTYGRIIWRFKLSPLLVIFISVAAGVGEEFLFRGVIQAYWGIWITAIVFVAIHGYLNPRDKKISLYGFYMILVISGMGYLTEYLGLVSAMAAHTWVDIILLFRMKNRKRAIPMDINEEL